MGVSGKAVLENVRKYRAIASLYRQTATFRPVQSWSRDGKRSVGNSSRWQSWKPTLRVVPALTRGTRRKPLRAQTLDGRCLPQRERQRDQR